MLKLLRFLGGIVGALLMGAIIGLILYFVADFAGVLSQITQELPFVRARGRLPFRGFVVFGGVLGAVLHLLGRLSRTEY